MKLSPLQADLVLKNGIVLTMNASQPRAEAVAIRGDRILDVGFNGRIGRWIGAQTKTIDLRGKTVVPGFIDTHAHMLGLGLSLMWLDLRAARSIKEMQQLLRKRVNERPRGKWIVGRGWDQERLKERRFPTRWDLDPISLDHPVILSRVCGHISVLNSRALELLHVAEERVELSPREVDRNPENGELTGLLRGKVNDQVWNMLPEPSKEDISKVCSLACQKAVKEGLTSVHWFVYRPIEIHALQELQRQGKLPLRAYIVVPMDQLSCIADMGLIDGLSDSFLKVGCVKIWADGSLGARTAALEEPYSDDPSTRGMMCFTKGELEKTVARIHGSSFQIAVHAIGDAAIGATLDAFEKALKRTSNEKRRHRIEHASVLKKGLLNRIKKLGLIVCVQPHFVVSDFWVLRRLGSTRARWTYPFKTLLESGIPIVFSSDAPAEPISPLLGIWAAVARKSFPEERISVEEALRAYTVDAAYASFEEGVKGSIEKDKLADLTVLSSNPLEIQPDDIGNIKVEMTIVGGRVVYSASS